MQAVKTESYGNGALYATSAIGGAIITNVATNKVKFLDSMMGRLILIALGIIFFVKAKSETVKGGAIGIAVGGASGIIGKVAGSVNGIEGLAGIDGDGVGEIVQDANGMIYMVNGVGELEEYYPPMINGVGEYDEDYDDDDDYEYVPLNGVETESILAIA
jgi:hypothetical protein